MSFRSVFFAGLLAVGLFGCGKQPEPRHIVILIDISGSIDRKALEQAFKAIDGLVGHLHRGNRIAIIPILGDAQAEASGRIIRFDVPINRQAYDSDLRGFRVKLNSSLEEMRAAAVAHPGSKTDILGSVVLAAQEFEAIPERAKGLLVILSDFIQEDGEIDFRRDMRMATVRRTREFAMQTARANLADFKGIPVYLGLLRSNEYGGLEQSRRGAIREFWVEYFKYCGAESRFIIDGPGLLEISSPNPLRKRSIVE